MATETPSTRNLFRVTALLGALREGPLARPELFVRLAGAYPPGDSLRRMVDRDIERLAELGIVITRSNTRPPVYALDGGTPVFSEQELRTLALVRDSFGARHPQCQQVRALLDRLTAGLTERERRSYQRRQALRAPVEPAIDYSAYAPLFDELNAAIHARRRLSFLYRPLHRPQPTRHDLVEPLEIEYYDRHFYLVAYTSNGRQVFDFRIDRIRYDETFRRLDYLPPELLHARSLITFRYRLAAALARGEISQRFERQRVAETLPNGDVVIEAEGRSDFFIIQTLLRYRSNAELLAPDWLRAQMAKEVRKLAGVYGVSTADDHH